MIVATFSLPHDALALGQTFQELLELKVEAERIAAHSRAWVMPYLWATNAEFETADEVDERIDTYVDQRGSVLDTEADADEWQVRIRFVSRDQFDAFRNSLTERGMRFELRDLTEPDSPRQTAAQLTPDQRDALVVARELGYYEVPRRRLTRNASEPIASGCVQAPMSIGSPIEALTACMRIAPPSIAHACIVSVGSDDSIRRERTLPSAIAEAAQKMRPVATTSDDSKFAGSGRAMTTTPATPHRRPTTPIGVSEYSGTKTREKPAASIGVRLTMIAAVAAVVCCWPVKRNA